MKQLERDALAQVAGGQNPPDTTQRPPPIKNPPIFTPHGDPDDETERPS